MRRRAWVAVTVGLVMGAGAVEACTTPVGGAPGGEDAGDLDVSPGPGLDGSQPAIDATRTPDTSAPPPADSSIPDGAAQPEAAPNEAAADVRLDTNPPTDSSEPDAADAAEPPDAADAGPTFTHYVFVCGRSQVESYGIDLSSGSLAPIDQTAAGGTTTYQNTNGGSLGSAFTANGNYLYVADTATHGIAAFQVQHGGLLSPIDADPAVAGVQDFIAGGGARFVVATPSFVFTANESAASISRFSIGAGGSLTSLGDVALPSGASPTAIAIDPTSRFLFSFNNLLSTITVFTIDGAGGLTPVDQHPVDAGGDAGPRDFVAPGTIFMGVVHPTLRTLYVSSGGENATNVILALAYDVNGVLSIDGVEPLLVTDGGSLPDTYGLAIDPAGAHLYAANYEAEVVNVFAINGVTGALTGAGTAPSTGELRAVSADPSGGFLYVAGDVGSVAGYAIASGAGALTSVGSSNSPSGGYTDPVGIIP